MLPELKRWEVEPDALTLLIRQRQAELRSLAAGIAEGRRARGTARPLQRRPLRLRLVALIFGPR